MSCKFKITWPRRRRQMYYGCKLPAGYVAQYFFKQAPSTNGIVIDESGNGNDAQLVQSNCLLSTTGAEVLLVPDLTGVETIISSGGTSIPSVGVGEITFTAGTCWDLRLSSGHIFSFAEGSGVHCLNKGVGANGVLSDITMREGKQTFYHTNYLDGFSEGLVTNQTGVGYLQSQNAFGSWTFDFIKAPNTTIFYPFISANTGGLDANRYSFVSANTNYIAITRGTATFLLSSGDGYVEDNVAYSVKVVRIQSGAFTLYIRGGAFGQEYVKVVAATGNNPTNPDTTFTTSAYSIFNQEQFSALLRYRKVEQVGMILGDSTIASYLGQDALNKILQEKHNFIADSIATPGDTILGQTAKWNALDAGLKSNLRYVIVEIGLNDNLPPIATTLADYQILIDTIIADTTDCKIVGSATILVKQRWIDLFGPVLGLEYHQKMLTLNDAIMGISNTITGLDYRNNGHLYILSDEDDNLKAEYDTGDHVHPNNAGREIIAQTWSNILQQEDYNKVINIPLDSIIPTTAKYNRFFIPALDAEKDVVGNTLTNKAGVWHNNSESYLELSDILFPQQLIAWFASLTDNKYLRWEANGDAPKNFFASSFGTISNTAAGTRMEAIAGGNVILTSNLDSLEIGKTYHYCIEIAEQNLGDIYLAAGGNNIVISGVGKHQGSFVATGINPPRLNRNLSPCDVTVSYFGFAEDGVIPLLSYSEMETNFKKANLAFMNLEDNKHKKLVSYNSALQETEVVKIMKCLKNNIWDNSEIWDNNNIWIN